MGFRELGTIDKFLIMAYILGVTGEAVINNSLVMSSSQDVAEFLFYGG